MPAYLIFRICSLPLPKEPTDAPFHSVAIDADSAFAKQVEALDELRSLALSSQHQETLAWIAEVRAVRESVFCVFVFVCVFVRVSLCA